MAALPVGHGKAGRTAKRARSAEAMWALRRQGMENRRRAGRRVGLGAVRNQESGQIWIGSRTDDLELVLG